MRFVILLLKVLFLCREISSERLHRQIYSSIEGGAACFRRLNGTHQVGCSSSESGAVGAVHMIREENDALWLVHNSTAGPYIAVVNTALFGDVIELLLAEPDNVAGVLLYDNATVRPEAFSQESQCPNEYSSTESTCSTTKPGGTVWNAKGTGLLRRNIPFPIFYLPQSRAEEIVKIEKCYSRYNLDKANQKGQPLCSIQLNSFMFAVLDTQVCLRRSTSTSPLFTPTKVCDPLGDYNVYYSLFSRAKPTKPVFLVTARIDAASLFDGVAPGAASSVVGMVTLIMAAASLAQMIPFTDAHLYDKNVLWTLFNGESFDYIGSQRVAYDIRRGKWPPLSPLKPTDIKLHVEVGQIGGSLPMYTNSSWPMYAYTPYDINKSPVIPPPITEFLAAMSNNLNGMTLMPEFSTNLPPSSIHSFRRILRNETQNGHLPEVLLTDYKDTFTNLFYESALDEADNIGFVYHNISIGANGTFIPTETLLQNGTMSAGEPQVKVARLATALARTLYRQLAGTEYTGNVSASAHLADEMLHCFVESQACRLLAAAELAGGAAAADARPAPLYVGVSAWPAAPAACAAHLLALLAGRPRDADRAACDKLDEPGFSFYYLKGWNHTGMCIQTTVNLSQAVSPAFIIPGHNMRSQEYSTWTESVWHAMWARVFVSASGAGARVAAATGAVATVLATALTYWLRRHAATVFALTTPAGTTTEILRSVNC
ncbi:nicastrin [Epargyreus clarus]|uniref:nicastrin n=1 Tax=Epargyreus clarus TaxID=520877 RepID=UPI003C2BEBB4